MCQTLKSFKDIRDENARLKGMAKKYEGRMSELEEAIKELVRRLDYYEKPAEGVRVYPLSLCTYT